MDFSVQSLVSPQMLCIAAALISASPSLPFFRLICHTHCEEANPCSSEICEYIVRNVCPSWHYNALYQLTRGVGGERGGREEDVKMLGTVWEPGEKKKKRELFVAAYLTGYEATQWLWHLAKSLPSMGIHYKRHPLTWGHICLSSWEREKEREFQEEKRQPEGVLEVPCFVNCPR